MQSTTVFYNKYSLFDMLIKTIIFTDFPWILKFTIILYFSLVDQSMYRFIIHNVERVDKIQT